MRIEIADLGDWGDAELRSEYDPDGDVIRINQCTLQNLPIERREEFIRQAIAHEMYHYLEHRGVIPVFENRKKREAAASYLTMTNR